MTIVVTNFSPTGDYANPKANITFDIYDDGNVPIDESTLQVRFEDSDYAILNGAFQDGYSGSISDIEVDGFDAKSVTVIPPITLFGYTVAISISADTSPSTSVQNFLYTFSTTQYIANVLAAPEIPTTGAFALGPTSYGGVLFSDRNFNILYQQSAVGAPIITARNPPVNGVNIDRETNVQFSLHDSGGEGVDIGSLDVFIAGEQVISDGFFVSPNIGSINSTTVDGFAGFTVTIDPDTEFSFSQSVSVRVIVSDLIPDPASVNTLDTTYFFTTEPFIDIIGPSPESGLPPTGVGLDACIEFDWLDAPFGDYPNFFTLNVTLIREITADCITDRREDVAVVNGVAAPGYELFANPIEIGNQKGYHVIICPDVPFNELEIITVVVNGDDSLGNSGTGTFEFSTVELTPPTILNLDPEPDETGVDPEASIIFEIHDQGGTGVDIDRLDVKIDDGEAVIGGVFQPGYSGSIENDRIIDEFGLDFDGYIVTIDRDIPYTPGKGIAVEIDGYDAYGNLATLVYDFTISPDITPPTYAFDPVGGTTGVNRDTLITVDVLDKIGVDTSSINITVQGQAAVTNGIPIAPFDVTVSEIVTVPGVVDGYRYIVDTENDFIFNKAVTTQVNAMDTAGNLSSASSTFTTFSDTTAPALTNITPGDNQLEVSLRPEITFVVRDAYDVAFDLTNVDIGGEPALRDGLIQSGFSMNLTRISGGTLGVDPGDGYAVILTPDADFRYNQTVEVEIEVFDRSENNRTFESVSWTTIDPAPPVFEIIPGPDDVGVAVDTNFVFEIFSDGYKVDISTLNFSIDGNAAIISNVVQEPDYFGTVTTIVDGYHYRGEIDPRYLLSGNTAHSAYISAREPISGNLGVLSYTFQTADDNFNPKTLYIGDSNGVKSIQVSEFDSNSTASVNTVFDGYHVYHIDNGILNYIHRLVVSTRDHGAIFYSTNYAWPTLFYSVGDEIIRAAITDQNNGTIYLANRTRGRIDVYYDILADDEGRTQPDVFYSIGDGYDDGYALAGLFDGYFTDMVVTKGTSTINAGSNSIFVGTSNGVFRIETDESVPGNTEINGELVSYGIAGGPHEYRVIEGTTNEVVAIDVNTTTNHLYVATRSPDTNDENTVTYIDLATNKRTSFIPEARLIHRLINDISFKNRT